MTDTSTDTHQAADTPEVVPPTGYGNGDTWADDGPWAVPARLRPFYAEAEPSETNLRAYLANGIDTTEEQSADVPRGIDTGDPSRAPSVVTTETIRRDTLVHWSGAAHHRDWLHQERLRVALLALNRADQEAARVASWFVCEMCGTKAPGVTCHRLPLPPTIARHDRLPVYLCKDCLPVADQAAREHFAARDAARVLPDGRPANAAAADLIADLAGD